MISNHLHASPRGVSNKEATITINLASNSLCNSIANSDYWQNHGSGQETIRIAPLPALLSIGEVPAPAWLKIDVEGHEMACLEGMASWLADAIFSVIIIEVGFNPSDTQHTFFGAVQAYLHPFGYLCAGIEDAEIVSPQWGATPHIGYANAIFVSPSSGIKAGRQGGQK